MFGKGQLHVLRLQNLVRCLQEREHAPDAKVSHGLIGDFLRLNRRDAAAQRGGQHGAVLVDALATQKRGKPSQIAGLVVKVHLRNHLVEREVVEALDELGVGTQEDRHVAGEHLLVERLGGTGDACFVGHGYSPAG